LPWLEMALMALASWRSKEGAYFNLSSCFGMILLDQKHVRFRENKSALRPRGLYSAGGVKNGVKGRPKRQLLSRK
jgi:hypothetical protein